jgi:hypothetical protein
MSLVPTSFPQGYTMVSMKVKVFSTNLLDFCISTNYTSFIEQVNKNEGNIHLAQDTPLEID